MLCRLLVGCVNGCLGVFRLLLACLCCCQGVWVVARVFRLLFGLLLGSLGVC